MINLFDNYSQETRDLHESLKKSGYQQQTIVIEANGFLPDDVISPYTYFLNNKKNIERGCFFNEVKTPDFWEISGDGGSARIKNYEKEQARIQYHSDSNNRIVELVEWLDEDEKVYQIDRYDKFGNVFAQTTVANDGQHLITTYFNANNQEVLVENHVTGNIILTLENENMHIFHGKIDYIKFFIDYLNLDNSQIFYNTLSYSFLVSHTLPHQEGKDILFWQEPIGNEIPGNMSLILNNEQHRTKRIVVPNQDTYEKMLTLVPSEQKYRICNLGYIYDFRRQNQSNKDAFIFTNSDEIEGLETLVQELPEVTFRIAAKTEMSQKLMDMIKFSNVILYQNIDKERIDYIFETSDLLLDINYYAEVMDVSRRSFENNMLIFSFAQTLHNSRYVAKSLIFDKENVKQMADKIKEVLASKSVMSDYIQQQQKQGDALTVELFQFELSTVLEEI